MGIASDSSAAHPAAINRMLSSDNAARKRILIHPSPVSSSGARWHTVLLLFMAEMCKLCLNMEEAHNALGMLSPAFKQYH